MLSLSAYAGMRGMTPAEWAARYREYARQCFAVAQGMPDAKDKLAMLDMAQAWVDLAALAERNQRLPIVYETP